MKKKILYFIITVLSIITILSITIFAEDRTFDEQIILTVSYSESSLNGYTGTVNYSSKIQYLHSSNYYYVYNIGRTYTNANLSTRCSFANGTTFQLNNGDKLKIPANTTLNDEQLNLLYLITELTPPAPPPPDPMDTVYDDGQNFLSNTHQNINTIIGFITRNPIITVFTIGIFLITITVGILYRLNNKTTKRKS